MVAKRKKKTQRQPHQKKLTNKDLKSLRNQPEYYSEIKARYTFALTPFSKSCLNQLAKATGLSMSECLERLLRSTADPLRSQVFAHTQLLITEPSESGVKSSE